VQVNGISIYSNKTVLEVNDCIVRFTDGSSCDVSTKHIHNVGNGFISFDESDREKSTLLNQSFNGITNSVINLSSNTKIDNSFNENTNSVIIIS
jgi:hypothetical protein